MVRSAVGRGRGLAGELLRGLTWNATATLVSTLTSFAVAALLARFLTPADLGAQAVVVTVVAFCAVLADSAVGSAIVRDPSLDGRALSSIFWGAIGASAAVYAAIFVGAPGVAWAFGIPSATALLRVAALGVVVLGASVVPSAMLSRRREFRTHAGTHAVATVIAGVAGVGLAATGWGAWALVGQSLTAIVARGAVLWWRSDWRPAATFDAADIRRVARHVASMATSVAVNFWSRNADILLIGRLVGVVGLGYYAVAYRLVAAPIQLLAGNLHPLLLPTFAAMGDDVPRQRAAYLRLVRHTALAMFPATVVLWVTAEPLVTTLAGARWAPSAEVVRALAPLVAVQPVNALSAPVLVARGASGLILRLTLLGGAAALVGMAIGVPHGVVGVAHGYAAAYVTVAAPASSGAAIRLVLRGRVRDLLGALLPGVAAAGVVLGVASAASRLAPAGAPAVVGLLLVLGASALSLAPVLYVVAVRARGRSAGAGSA